MSKKIPYIIVILLCASAGAYAQVPRDPGSTGVKTSGVSGKKLSQLSAAELLSEGRVLYTRTESNLGNLVVLVDEATGAQDTIKANCRALAKSEVEQRLPIAKDKLKDLEDAAGRNDEADAVNLYTQLVVIFEDSQTQLDAAQQCLGNESGFVGDTQNSTYVDPNIRADNPTVSPETLPPPVDSTTNQPTDARPMPATSS